MKPAPEPPAELLLGRPEFGGDLAEAAAFARDRRVLVTGAAGSVGTPLARVLAEAEPARLLLVDHHEYSLFRLERASPPSPRVSHELADVRDTARMRRMFEHERPEIVFHLAAAKHVPYGERFVEGAIATNVLATAELLELARATAVERFVYPSSDKSVQPPALYGATKRVAEALLQHYAGVAAEWSVVRFVNIIGTRGSVIEIFTEQILDDRLLSVTDERMTRYWISMREALWSLLSAAACGRGGQVLMPACGAPVPIVETARRLAGWYRPDRVPYPICSTGTRPGERLHEVLLSDNEWFQPGPVNGLKTVCSRRGPAPVQALPAAVADLRMLVDAGERDELRRRSLALAEALQ
ncbi:MAG: polysaccharide biosynthesis protein [Chloroflexota bacterium]|nr:polysaccharide biosynthesis protein [Chloroflexota bacterium]